MDWWCSSTRQVWDWTPRPYVGSFIIVGALVAFALWWRSRGRDETAEVAPEQVRAEIRGSRRGRSIAFVLGAIGLWAVLDWPLATLGAGYLATAQMTRQIVTVMVIAPLLLFATPPELAVRFVGWGRRLTLLKIAARPGFAIPVVVLTLIIVNTPMVSDPLLPTVYGSFVVDIAWITAGFVLWMPVQCPHPGVERLSGGTALVYLIGQSVVPVLPGFFMTWANFPLFRTYELAPRVIDGFGPVDDQQTAAAILQVGGMVLLWTQLAYRFLSWGQRQVAADQRVVHAMHRGGDGAP